MHAQRTGDAGTSPATVVQVFAPLPGSMLYREFGPDVAVVGTPAGGSTSVLVDHIAVRPDESFLDCIALAADRHIGREEPQGRSLVSSSGLRPLGRWDTTHRTIKLA